VSAPRAIASDALDPAAVEVLLCDADGCLFPSEEPAFAASAEVTNRCLAELGVERRFDAEGLRRTATGRTFRATIVRLASEAGAGDALTAARLEAWVEEERRAVTAYLAATLEPDPAVKEPLARLASTFRLAVVSSSALARLDACFDATGLAGLFPPHLRYSAEDSLPVPTSKPDPAIYALAGGRLGVAGPRGLAIEDSEAGARSAVAAGFATVGNVAFVAPDERDERVAALRRAGVHSIVASWTGLAQMLGVTTQEGVS
jgi:beta-phosphoglucomutase-like phosphatase (HAD superfamily)